MFNDIEKNDSLDIHSKGEYPSNMLSNFYPHTFVYDGIKCASIEGILQSLTHNNIEKQLNLCKLYGYNAKQKSNKDWKEKHKLHWLGKEYDRFSDDYSELIKNIYISLAECSQDFRKALLSTDNKKLTHSIGNSNPKETILTESYFCYILMNIRNDLNNNKIIYKDITDIKLKDEAVLLKEYKDSVTNQYSLF